MAGDRAIVLSNIFYSYGESLNAAFLPELARRDALGRVSGWGWSFGYFGGMLTLGLSLGYVLWAQGAGHPCDPVRAGDDAHHRRRLCAGLAADLRAAEGARGAPAHGPARKRLRASLQRLAQTWRHAQDYRDFVWLLGCAVAYQSGIAVVIALAAVYAEQVLGFQQTQTMMLIFLVNIASAVGPLPSAIGKTAWPPHRPGRHAGRLDRDDAAGGGGDQCRAVLGGRGGGRAVHGLEPVCRARDGRRLCPEHRLAEFFGLWTFAVRLAAILGPMTYGM